MTRNFRTRWAALAVLWLPVGSTFGQDAVAEPEYVGDIIAIEGGAVIPLEKQRVSNRARAGALRARASNEIEGIASPVRLSQQPLVFIVRHETNSVNPTQIINVFRLDTNDRRETRFIETGSTGAFSSQSMDIAFLPFDSERHGESSYRITLQGELEPGEYAITLEGSRDVFNLFGLD